MTTKAEFRQRIQSLQWAMLIINVFVIAIGGSMFGLAVVTRPILRITQHDHHGKMQTICDVMVGTGIVQIVVAGYDIFAACWKLVRVIYGAVLAALIAVIVEIACIVLNIYVQSESDAFLSHDVLRPWFVWECLPSESCNAAWSYYIYYFMIPQIALSAISIVLHCLSILYFVKLIRTLREKQNQIWKAKELRSSGNHKAFGHGLGSSNSMSKLENNNLLPHIEEHDDDEHDDEHEHLNETPPSILKHEHGYVPAAGSSLDKDYDDSSVVRNRSKLKEQQSLSFNTNVEIHLFNPQESEEGHHDIHHTTQM